MARMTPGNSHDEHSAANDHWLVVSEFDGERDYEIEHDGCVEHEEPTGVEGIPPFCYYLCGVGELWAAAGHDAVPDIDTIPVGRHPVAVHVEHTPSLPTNGGEEWDAWIEVTL